MNAEVYYNVRAKVFSVRKGGRVVDAGRRIRVDNVVFAIQPAGRAKFLKTGRKNVHAFVRGKVNTKAKKPELDRDGWHLVRYNPRLDKSFVVVFPAPDFADDAGRPLKHALQVWLQVTPDGPRVYALHPRF